MVNDPFHREQALLDNIRKIAKKGGDAKSATIALNTLVKGYGKLLRQSRRLITMGDRMQMTLNELNSNLAVSEQKFRGIFENVVEGIFRSTPAGEIIEVNPAMADMFGYQTPELFMAELRNIKDLFCSSDGYACYKEGLEKGNLRRLELSVCSPRGRKFWAEVSTSVMESEEGKECSGIVGVLADVTERKSMMEEMCRLARTDNLTGLCNRGYFMELGDREIMRCRRDGIPCSILLIDVDFFKKVNDRYGHDIGDKVLKELAVIMCESVRDIDIVARIGGEEFVAMLPSTNAEEALIVARRISENVRAACITAGEEQLRITVSMGLSTFCTGVDLERIMKNADIALYAAKKNGRDRVEEYRDKCPCISGLVQSGVEEVQSQ